MFAGRVRDRVAAHFGENSVFIDVDNIPFGKDFRVHIQEEMAQADVVLVIIGSKWLGVGKGGHSRIKEETDPVRIEVETALVKGIPTIPVLVGQTKMPKPEQLPDSLKDFSFINAASVDTGRDFHRDLDRVIGTIDGILERSANRREQASAAAEIAVRAEAPPITSKADEASTENLEASGKAEAAAESSADSGIQAELEEGAQDRASQPAYGAPSRSGTGSGARHGGRIAAVIGLAGVVALGLAWVFSKSTPNTAPPPIAPPTAPSPAADAQPPAGAAQPYGAAPAEQPVTAPPASTPYGTAADPGAEVVREFYQYLGAGDGDSAAKLIVAEKRSGNFSPQRMTQFYGSDFYARLRLLSVVATAASVYQATYTFQKYQGGPVCTDTVTVTVTERYGQYLIQNIQAPPHGC